MKPGCPELKGRATFRRLAACCLAALAALTLCETAKAQCMGGGGTGMGTGTGGTAAIAGGLTTGSSLAAASNALQIQNSLMMMEYMQSMQMQHLALQEELARLRSERSSASTDDSSKNGVAFASLTENFETAADQRESRVSQVSQRREARLARIRDRKAARLARQQD